LGKFSKLFQSRKAKLFCGALVLPSTIFFSENSSAETDSLIEAEPAAQAVVRVEPKIETKPAEPSKMALSLLGGPAFNSYRLVGSGFTSTIPNSSGAFYGLRFSYSPPNKTGAFFSVNRSSNEHTGFTTVSPNSVTIRHTRLDAGFTLQLSEDWNFLAGYGYARREGTQTTPTAVVGQYESHGIVLGLEHLRALGGSGRWKLQTFGLLRLPLYFYEAGSATGAHIGSTEAELGTGIFFKVWRELELALGVRLRGSFHFYRGTGNRGVSEAREQDLLILTPLEARWTF